MKHEILYNLEDMIAEMRTVGNITSEEASKVLEQLEKVLEGKPNRQLYADISESPTLQMEKKARTTLAEGGKTLNLDRIAIMGSTPINRMLAKVILAVLGKSKDTKFFDSRDEAVSWLREGNNESQNLVR